MTYRNRGCRSTYGVGDDNIQASKALGGFGHDAFAIYQYTDVLFRIIQLAVGSEATLYSLPSRSMSRSGILSSLCLPPGLRVLDSHCN